MTSVLNAPRAMRLLEAAGVDALVATSFQNVFYLAGYVGFSQRVLPATQVYAVARADALDQPVLVAPLGDLDMLAQVPARLGGVHPYGRFFVEPRRNGALLTEELARYEPLALQDPGGTPAGALLEELARLPSGARIALDESGLAPQVRDAVLAQFGERVVPGADLLARIRMVKTREEIDRLERSALVMEASIQAALAAAHAGMSEAEMARVFDARTVEQGAAPHFTVIAFGERAAFPNAVPSPARRLRRGDLIRFDVGCIVDLYRSDISRTAVFGPPSADVRQAYEAILAGEERALEAMRPGVPAREVFDAAMRGVQSAGLPGYRRHHVGHGIGLETYDLPMLNPATETPLESGMVFEVETPYYELGFGGVQVEDTVVVTDEGCGLLTRSSRELTVIGT